MKRLLMVGVLVVAGSATFVVFLANTLVELIEGKTEVPRDADLYGR